MVDYNSLSDAYKTIYEAAKAKKDYDGDGTIESGAKEHAGAVHNEIQKKRGLKPDGKDTTGIKEEEIVDEDDLLDENRRMARDPEGRNSGHSKQPDPSKSGFTGVGNMSIDQIRKMSARIEKEKTKKEEVEYVDEKTAMAKRGYDEAPIRKKIAKSTGGGKSADRATDLENRSTYGDANKAKQRQNYARKQRGDFRKTTSSSPGLHGYAHKSDDPKVKEKQAARGAQRGALTPNEKKELNREEFELWVNNLVDEGYDLSDYTWDEMLDIYEGEGSYGKTPKARQAMGKLAIARREKPASEYSQKGEKTKKVKSIEKHTRRIDNGPDAGDRSKKSTKPRYSGFAGKSGRGKLDQDSRDYARDSAVEYTSGGHKPGPGTVTKNPKKLRKQRAMGEISKESFEAWLDEAMTNYEKNRKRAAQLKKEEFGAIVTSLVDLGFDLSQYTIDEMVQMCYDAMDQIEIEESCGTKHGSDTKNKKPSKKNYRESFNLPNARVSFSRQEKVVESGPSEEQIAEAAPAIVAAAGRLAASQSVKGAAKKAGTKLATAGVEAIVDKIGDRIAGKRDEEA